MQHHSYSARLGTITPKQFQAALDRFGLGQFIEAQPIGTGLFGQNVFVTSTAGEWVLRGSPHYDWQFRKEQFFARLIHERSEVPVPWPYLLDPTSDIFGWEYLLMPRLPGLQTYLTKCPPRPGFAERFAVYMLAERVIVWDFAQRHPELGWLDRSLTLREWAEPYLEAIDSLVQGVK